MLIWGCSYKLYLVKYFSLVFYGNTELLTSYEMTGNKCTKSSNVQGHALISLYYLFLLYKFKFQNLIRTKKEFRDLLLKHFTTFCISFIVLHFTAWFV